MTTGSSTWTIGGWTFLVLPLGSTVSFVPQFQLPTTGADNYDMSGPHQQVSPNKLCSTAFTGAGAGTGDVCLSRSRALTISFNSATS
ncbi:hypothetical protein Tco_0327129 [Tanacetum coccineum]